jgi:hypothetical protein
MIKKVIKIVIITIIMIFCSFCMGDSNKPIKNNNYKEYFELLSTKLDNVIYDKNKTMEAERLQKMFNRTIKIDTIETKKLLIYIDSLCIICDVDYKYVIGMISQESRWNNFAIGGEGYGLMQITPIAAKSLNMQYGDILFDPYYNVLCGILYLSNLHNNYNDINKAIVAYNTGSTYVNSIDNIENHTYLLGINYWVKELLL